MEGSYNDRKVKEAKYIFLVYSWGITGHVVNDGCG